MDDTEAAATILVALGKIFADHDEAGLTLRAEECGQMAAALMRCAGAVLAAGAPEMAEAGA